MSDFDPGDGWRRVDISEPASAVYELAQYGPNGELIAGWVRTAPVLPLPTEPFTVIRATVADDLPPQLYVHDGEHLAGVSQSFWLETVRVGGVVEVLAEPRQVTWNAVRQAIGGWLTTAQLIEVSKELGVDL